MTRSLRTLETHAAPCVLLALCLAGPARADADPVLKMDTEWSVGVFVGQGLHNDVADIPGDVFSGDINYAHSYVGEGLVRYALPVPSWFPGPGTTFPVTHSLEFGVYDYRGLSHNGAVSLDWRPSTNLFNIGGASFDLAWGFGVWQAFGTPWYNHSGHAEENTKYKTLFHMTPELVFRNAALPGWQLGLRVNHVSGVYGWWAPSELGTNHAGMTLVKSF